MNELKSFQYLKGRFLKRRLGTVREIFTESLPFIWQSLYGYKSVSEIFLVTAILVSNPAATSIPSVSE